MAACPSLVSTHFQEEELMKSAGSDSNLSLLFNNEGEGLKYFVKNVVLPSKFCCVYFGMTVLIVMMH
jgi:hypothetical protein